MKSINKIQIHNSTNLNNFKSKARLGESQLSEYCFRVKFFVLPNVSFFINKIKLLSIDEVAEWLRR